MTNIIPVAFSARWQPVYFAGAHEAKKIRGPGDAIRHMRDCFGDKSTPAYSRAISICLAAIRREADIDMARIFFLAAYEDHVANLERRQ